MGGGNDNEGVGCDYVAGDLVCDVGCVGTDKCGSDGVVVGFVEVINVGYVEEYSRGGSGG